MNKSATIVESSGKSVELKEAAGLYECLLEHELKSTKADFNWKGKYMSTEMWHEILAFFKWTQDTEKSESQVRLFVHPEHGWMAWAFPQKGGTRMTTKEIDNEDAKNQRALNIPEGYIAFGTVHHHCTASAFQSGVDTADEKNVDGLHITIGNLDQPKYDIHCRLYIKAHKFEPDMSAFWDIGQDAKDKIKFVGDLGFSAAQIADKVARIQMCEKPAAETPFNDIWKANYIVDPPLVPRNGTWCRHCSGWVTTHTEPTCPNKDKPIGGTNKVKSSGGSVARNGRTYETATEALESIETQTTLLGLSDVDLGLMLQEMGNGELAEVYSEIFEKCADQLLTPSQLWNAYQNRELKRSKQAKTPDQQDAKDAIEEWQRQQAESNGWDGYGH
jgi:hypothetical protein